MPRRTGFELTARSLHTAYRFMEPSEVTVAEKWLLVIACTPIIFAGLLFLVS